MYHTAEETTAASSPLMLIDEAGPLPCDVTMHHVQHWYALMLLQLQEQYEDDVDKLARSINESMYDCYAIPTIWFAARCDQLGIDSNTRTLVLRSYASCLNEAVRQYNYYKLMLRKSAIQVDEAALKLAERKHMWQQAWQLMRSFVDTIEKQQEQLIHYQHQKSVQQQRRNVEPSMAAAAADDEASQRHQQGNHPTTFTLRGHFVEARLFSMVKQQKSS